jgi:TolB-like protein/Flp pilus assembly protein TadD
LHDIFLSYGHDDLSTASRFAEGFEREGFTVWWDASLRTGEAFDAAIESALKSAKAVVVLWSRTSVQSRWVRAEATLADRNRTLVPAMIEPCDRPIMFELTHTADLARWSGDASDRTWQGFLADVRRFVGAAGAAPSEATSPQLAMAGVARPAATRGGRPSLAILPFTNRSGERADDVFADGMVEDLISALSLGDLKVIAQSATVVYRKNVSDLRSIGRDLGVRYLLEGNVRRVGGTLRVTAQLVEADNGAILWSQKFDRPLTELADLQEQLVLEVAGHLGVQVERVEMEKALKKPGDLTAWEAVMRASATFADDVGFQAGSRSIAEARKAVAIEPDYALGHATLASALAHYYMAGGGREPAIAREGLAQAERALVLAPNDPKVLSSVAIAMGYCGAWREALTYARRSVDLNPNRTTGRGALAMLSIRFNKPDDAIMHLSTVESLAPRGPFNYLAVGARGLAHFQAGRYEEALQAAEQSLLDHPNFIYALKDRVIYLEKLGRQEEAREAVRRLRSANRDITLDDVETANVASFCPPEMAADMNATFRKVWLETPLEIPRA